MPGLVPGIHVLVSGKDVDGRVFNREDDASRLLPGHDELRDTYQPRVAAASQSNTLKTNGFRSRL